MYFCIYLIGYYRDLNYDQQSQILSFLHVLINTLQNYTFGVNPNFANGDSYAPVVGTPVPGPSSIQNVAPIVETSTVKEPVSNYSCLFYFLCFLYDTVKEGEK